MLIKAWYRHGSEDSLDDDIYYVVDKITSFNDAKSFCDSVTEQNVNIITIDNGLITSCYKGTLDEIQNSLIRTYPLHEQSFKLLIETPVKRDILLKTIRVVRCFLSHTTRTQYRKEVKKALNEPNWNLKISTIRLIDFNSILDFKDNKVDVIKVFAFQLAQILGLLENVEIYTKSEASSHFPKLKKYLYREPADLDDLLIYLNNFLDYCDTLKNVEDFIDLKTEKRKKPD